MEVLLRMIHEICACIKYQLRRLSVANIMVLAFLGGCLNCFANENYIFNLPTLNVALEYFLSCPLNVSIIRQVVFFFQKGIPLLALLRFLYTLRCVEYCIARLRWKWTFRVATMICIWLMSTMFVCGQFLSFFCCIYHHQISYSLTVIPICTYFMVSVLTLATFLSLAFVTYSRIRNKALVLIIYSMILFLSINVSLPDYVFFWINGLSISTINTYILVADMFLLMLLMLVSFSQKYDFLIEEDKKSG